MTMKGLSKIYVLVATLCFACVAYAQSPKARTGVFALTNASIQTVTNGVITNGTVVISGVKITDKGAGVGGPAGAAVCGCRGRVI